MHAFTALVLALAGSTLAAPVIEERDTSSAFRLTAVSENLTGWAVLEAHVAAGTNAIEIQRPSAYQSEKVKLSGTTKQLNNGKAKLQSHKAAGSTFQYVLPEVHTGQVKQVFAELGVGSNSFGINDNNRLTANGQANG